MDVCESLTDTKLHEGLWKTNNCVTNLLLFFKTEFGQCTFNLFLVGKQTVLHKRLQG